MSTSASEEESIASSTSGTEGGGRQPRLRGRPRTTANVTRRAKAQYSELGITLSQSSRRNGEVRKAKTSALAKLPEPWYTTSWSCELCTFLNDSGINCSMCSHRRTQVSIGQEWQKRNSQDTEQKADSSSSTASQASSPNSIDPKSISSVSATQQLPPDEEVDLVESSDDAPQDNKTLAPIQEPVVSDQGWQCERCTYLNEDSTRKACEICGFTRKIVGRGLPYKRKGDRRLEMERKTTLRTVRSQSTRKIGTESFVNNKLEANSLAEEQIEHYESSNAVQQPISNVKPLKGVRRARPGALSLQESELWAEKYRPMNAEELALNKKKVTEVEEWLKRSLRGLRSRDPHCPRLLILCGRPGIGKSAMLQILARSLGLTILQWDDLTTLGNSSFSQSKLRHAYDMVSWDAIGSERPPLASQATDFESFLVSSAQYPTLSVCTKSTHHDASASVKSSVPSVSSQPHIVVMEDFPAASFSANSFSNHHQASLLALFQQALRRAIDLTAVPLVAIVSDVTDSKVSLAQLARIFTMDVMNDYRVGVIQVNPVAQGAMKKRLTEIASKERMQVTADAMQDIIDGSGGDFRHALNSLQFHCLLGEKVPLSQTSTKSKKRRAKSKNEPSSQSNSQGKQLQTSSSLTRSDSLSGRDSFCSGLHGIGKILYGKKESFVHPDGSERLVLSFEPESIVSSVGMDAATVLAFVDHNCPTFFTNIEELSQTLSDFASADVLQGAAFRILKDREDRLFPDEYIASIGGRSIAERNKSPAPRTFRPITKPELLALHRQKKANQEALRDLLGGRAVSSSAPGAAVFTERYLLEQLSFEHVHERCVRSSARGLLPPPTALGRLLNEICSFPSQWPGHAPMLPSSQWAQRQTAANGSGEWNLLPPGQELEDDQIEDDVLSDT